MRAPGFRVLVRGMALAFALLWGAPASASASQEWYLLQWYQWEYQTHCQGGCILGQCCVMVIP